MNRLFVTALCLLASGRAFSQAADAPRLDVDSELILQNLEVKEAQLELRASRARAVRGIGVGAFVVGTVSTAGFAVGNFLNFGARLGAAISLAAGGGAGPALPDYSPLLVTAIVGVAFGLVGSILGGVAGSRVEAEREALESQRTEALAAFTTENRIRWREIQQPLRPPPLAEGSVPSAPPAPPTFAGVEPVRTPLRPLPVR